jgi:5-methylcytosine-specific restriction protein A
MSDNWTSEELEAAVEAYLEMRRKFLDGEDFRRVDYYRALADRFPRSTKSFEYRMQNISYVFALMGRRWIKGLAPLTHVGSKVASQIEAIINKREGRPPSQIAEFSSSVSNYQKKKKRLPPEGNRTPPKTKTGGSQFVRDPGVVAWVLDLANGFCECCNKEAPFSNINGTPYLEVHHVRRLADGGPDIVENAIAICPNCHREFHYGQNREQLRNRLLNTIERLEDW